MLLNTIWARWLGELAFGRAAGSQPAQQRDRNEVQHRRRGVHGQAGPDSASPDQNEARSIGSCTTDGLRVA